MSAATFELLDSASDPFANPVVTASFALTAEVPLTVGRELSTVLATNKRISRKQICVTISSATGATVQRTGPNASYLQHPGGEPVELARNDDTWTTVPNGAIIWLTLDPQSRAFCFPCRICTGSANAMTAPPPQRPPPSAPGVWEVKLGGAFKPYDADTQGVLEAAFMAGDRVVDVMVRGAEYQIYLHPPARQHAKADPTKTRAVRRQGGDPPPLSQVQSQPGAPSAPQSASPSTRPGVAPSALPPPVASASGNASACSPSLAWESSATAVASTAAPADVHLTHSGSDPAASIPTSAAPYPYAVASIVGPGVTAGGKKRSLKEIMADEAERVSKLSRAEVETAQSAAMGEDAVGGGMRTTTTASASSHAPAVPHASPSVREPPAAAPAAPAAPTLASTAAFPAASSHAAAMAPPPTATPANRTLAFPSISTGAFRFDTRRAATIMVREVVAFLRRHAGADVALVLVEPDAATRSAMLDACAAEPGLAGDGRFQLAPEHATLTTLRSASGAPLNGAAFIGNASNSKLSPRGGYTNRLIHDAAGKEELAALTRERHHPHGTPGSAYPVGLPPSNALRLGEGVSVVIHAVGPNMNPEKPNCLEGDYATGVEQLAATYHALFEAFYEASFPRASEGDGDDADAEDVLDELD